MLEVDAGVIVRSFNAIVDGAMSEPPRSTPIHLQPVRRPEFNMVAEALPAIMEAYDGAEMPIDILYKLIESDIMRLFLGKFLHTKNHGRFNQLRALLGRPIPATLGLPPVLYEFAKRSLTRSLQFCDFRVCMRDLSCVGWHTHGSKQSYNLLDRVDE